MLSGDRYRLSFSLSLLLCMTLTEEKYRWYLMSHLLLYIHIHTHRGTQEQSHRDALSVMHGIPRATTASTGSHDASSRDFRAHSFIEARIPTIPKNLLFRFDDQSSVYACCACPCRKANKARTSVQYCRPSSRGIRCRSSLSVGSLIHPSMGIALST